MKGVNLKKALELMGYKIVQYNKNYNYRSGFMTKGDQLYYFSYEDLRWDPTLMIRTADPTIKDKKGNYADYRGGQNTYPMNELMRLGYRIHEPRQACDFNSN